MFDRFIRLAKARKALRDRRFEEVLAVCADPVVRDDRRAEQLRAAAAAALLERAERRLSSGDLAAARADARAVAATASATDADDLLRRIAAAAAGEAAAESHARRTLAEVRKLAERGETAAAAALLASVEGARLLFERQQLQQLLRERAARAAETCREAEAALASGDAEAAVRLLERARALDRDGRDVMVLAARVAEGLARVAEAAVAERLAAGDPIGATDRLEAVLTRLGDRSGEVAFAPLRRRVADALVAGLGPVGSVAAALPFVTAARRCGVDDDPRLEALVAVVPAAAAAAPTDGGEVARRLAAAAQRAGADGLVAAARAMVVAADADERLVARAREHVARGELAAARLELLRVLAEQPGNALASRELGLVEHGLADLQQRLEAARAALHDARLQQACTLALPMVGSDRVGAEAQQIAADARTRMALVDRGVDEVRVALHGRLAAGVEGVRHCLRRLQELAKVQADHERLPELAAAVEAEIEALGQVEAATTALAQGELDAAATAVATLQPLAPRLLSADRLEARVCALADALLGTAERELAVGGLTIAERCAGLLEQLRPARSEYGRRAAEVRAAAGQRRDVAARLVADARSALQLRDLAEAERLVEAAAAQWRDGPEAKRLAVELAQLREQTAALADVASMARELDYVGAQRKLAAMPPTQPLLRTRIYDMKQDLARAQGLEGAFLLRVDEGGEHLVLRGESLSIGNVRKRRADLPVLANLSGRHAIVRRSMSFHGGMQDAIEAEDGEVRVGGEPVRSRQLADGDRVQLGPAFAFVYRRPSGRSLTAVLQLQAGFQVAGTDRVLLMKDRGRDGRILLGAGKDAHVRVARATGEVELFATNTGQVRVRCAAGGTIDGIAFRGEHPVAAGQVVEAAGTTFVLYPWHRDA